MNLFIGSFPVIKPQIFGKMVIWKYWFGIFVFASSITSAFSDFDGKFLRKAQHNLEILRDNCMYSWLYENPSRPIKFPKTFEFPLDAREHLNELNSIAKQFRNIPYHEYNQYSGPWVENIWCNKFNASSIETFGGMIPLFFNWVDTQIKGELDVMIEELRKVLRPNVIYITVSQSDEGIHNLQFLFPNVLVLSAGGMGHVPIPLVKGEVPYRPPPQKYQYNVSFLGSDRDERHLILTKAIDSAKKAGFTTANTYAVDWKEHVYGTKFNLAPRGYGRSSFRLAEVIQMGRIPVALYTDVNWLPYLGTKISLEHYGFYAGWADVESLMMRLKSISQSEMQNLYKSVKDVRHYYTYEGIMEQIEAFMRDPLGTDGGYLRCIPVPRTTICCG